MLLGFDHGRRKGLRSFSGELMLPREQLDAVYQLRCRSCWQVRTNFATPSADLSG